jgi:hypothetical protein
MKSNIKYAPILFSLIMISFIACKEKNKQVDHHQNYSNSQGDSTKKAVTDSISVAAKTVKKDTLAQVPLSLNIENLASANAPVIVGLYGTKNEFPEPDKQLKEYRFTPKSKTLKAVISDQPFGRYAIAIYQDVNSDGKIDKNVLGIPTEGYAFSNNIKPKVKAPNFDECSFDYNKKHCSISMKMIQ